MAICSPSLFPTPTLMKSQFLQKVESYARMEGLDLKAKMLVAISGGADSVALLRMLLEAEAPCVAAHCNFHLRGEESNRDEAFVKLLCSALSVPLKVKHFNVEQRCHATGESVELACRNLRYQWFEQLRSENGCSYIAVAHHADDCIETMMINLLRTTGIKGLRGIRPLNGNIMRPLLCIGRQDIIDYLNDLRQDYVTDSTNLESDFVRNKVRNIILPEIYRLFPTARQSMLATMTHLHDDSLLADAAVDSFKDTGVTTDNGNTYISRQALSRCASPSGMLHALLYPMGFSPQQCRQIATATRVGARFYSHDKIVEVAHRYIIVTTSADHSLTYRLDLAHPDASPITLTVEIVEADSNFRFESDSRKAYFDEAILTTPLSLRHWHEGDRFSPYGMKGTKLLSDYFSDNHYSIVDKRRQWLLVDDNDRILWVVGKRSSRLLSVTSATKRIVILTLISPNY